MAFSLEARQRGRDLFVESALSYEDVSKETGIAVNTLKSWGVAEKWTDQREEYQKQYSAFHAKISKLQLQLVDSALESKDAQAVYALANLMRAKHTSNGAGAGQMDRPAIVLDTLTKLVEFIRSREPNHLGYLEPHIKAFAEVIRQG